MPAFVSPVVDPGSWSYSTVDAVAIPSALRFGGYAFRGLRATIGADTGVQMPATGVLRMVTAGGMTFVEVQVIPFPIRHVATAIPGGLPTFYLIFPDATGLTFTDGEAALGGTFLRSATSVIIVAVGQDRVALDPSRWAANITAALNSGGGDSSLWGPFATAVSTAIGTGDTAPVLLYDHAGQLRTSGTVGIVIGPPEAETVYTAVLDPADGGDLQRTVARLHFVNARTMPLANLWGGGRTSFRLRPPSTGASEIQLTRLEDGTVASTEITVTPDDRMIAFTNLFDWFSRQYAATGGPNDLARFSRDNLVTPIINGPEYFDDFFSRMHDAKAAGAAGGVSLAGWAMFPQTKLTKRELGDDPEEIITLDMANSMNGGDQIPITLEQAAKMIQDAGGKARFLPAKFYQLQDGATVSAAEALVFHLIIDAILILNALGVSAAKTDVAGVLILFVAWLAATVFTSIIVDEDGKPIEPNKDAVDILGAVTGGGSVFSPYPARVEDNVPAPSLTDFPFDVMFVVTRHFGIYHQKMSIVKVGDVYFGYCGGVDCNPDRLDTVDHLAKSPYHDVHARIEGNAVRDLAQTLEERWQRDGGGLEHAFDVPAIDPALAPGRDIAQIGRTYYAPVAGAESRALAFAPNGDRTIANTILAAIAQARETIYIEDQYLVPPQVYTDALVAKITAREIKQLIITVPGRLDMFLGEAARDTFVHTLIAADAGAGIVRIGFPRRRFTSTDNSLRASSGRMLLGQDLPAGDATNQPIFLAPPARIPDVPFWVSVEGELMYVYDESTAPNPEPDNMKAFLAERGTATQIVSGDPAPAGTFPREHKRGAAALAIDLSDIYVHAKMMIVDDVFLSIGSANLDRRGFFYDGEVNVFTIPDALRTSPRNPAVLMRQRLWAEMLDLPADMAAPLLTDPMAAAKLFDRPLFAGNRFMPLDAQTPVLMRSFTTGDGAIGDIIQLLGFTVLASNYQTLFTQITDPTSRTVSAP